MNIARTVCRGLVAGMALGLAAAAGAASSPSGRPEAAVTLVVFNDRDPSSVELAGYYAERRGIPFTNLVGIEIEPKEEITREEYDAQIARPLRQVFSDRGWWRLERGPDGIEAARENRMRFVAVMRGVPLKIAPTTAPYPGDEPAPANVPPPLRTNAASVDSELALLGVFTRKITGPLNNPYYESETPFLKTDLTPMLLVCRLDAADVKTVKRMIDDALAVERDGLWGFCYADLRGLQGKDQGGLVEGDRWIQAAAVDAQKRGLPVILDNGEAMFPDAYPMRHAALYYGWYAHNVGGPIAQPDFVFARGAVAVHIHSFSAASLRDPARGWAAPLLAHGCAATLGNVYEPLLGLTANLAIFQKRLGAGFTFAEAGYISLRGLSWMATFVGDPLYRPFPRFVDEDKTPAGAPPEWVACRDGLRLWLRGDAAAGRRFLGAAGKRLRNGVPFETLGLLEAAGGKLEAAFNAFAQARNFYPHREDQLRTWIHQVNLLRFKGRKGEALAETRRLIRRFPNERATGVLRLIELQLAPPPPSPSPSPAQASGRAAPPAVSNSRR